MYHSISPRLADADVPVRVAAVKDAVRQNRQDLAGQLLDLYVCDRSSLVRGRAAWALGTLKYRPALQHLIRGLNSVDAEVKQWSAWALGEIGDYLAEPSLRQSGDREQRPALRSAIFGAIKKLNFETTREHYDAVARRLKPPVSNDSRIQSLVHRLEGLENHREIVNLRRQIKDIDSVFFATYMVWVARRPTIEAALQDPRLVFGQPMRH